MNGAMIRDWIGANPDRRFHIYSTEPSEGRVDGAPRPRLTSATVIEVTGDGWWTENILVVGEIVYTDAAAAFARRYHRDFLIPRLIDDARMRGCNR